MLTQPSAIGTNFRLRNVIEAVTIPASLTPNVRYRKQGTTTWLPVPVGSGSGSPVYISASPNITAGGESTTSQISSGTFSVGRIWDDENSAETISFTPLPPHFTGGIVTDDGTWRTHTFTMSDTLTYVAGVGGPVNAEYLVVAGGGGGARGSSCGGGGGAGGLLASTATLSASRTVTIGAGGAGSSTLVSGTNGSNTSLGAVTATGGGGGSYGGVAGSRVAAVAVAVRSTKWAGPVRGAGQRWWSRPWYGRFGWWRWWSISRWWGGHRGHYCRR